MRKFLTMTLAFVVLFSTSVLLAQRSFREPNPSTSDNSFRQSGGSFRTTQGDRADRTRNPYRYEASTSQRGNDNHELSRDSERQRMDRIRDR